MKKTPWFSGELKPRRPGYYEVKCRHDRYSGFLWWAGLYWYLNGNARADDQTTFGQFCDSWRGLTKQETQP